MGVPNFKGFSVLSSRFQVPLTEQHDFSQLLLLIEFGANELVNVKSRNQT